MKSLKQTPSQRSSAFRCFSLHVEFRIGLHPAGENHFAVEYHVTVGMGHSVLLLTCQSLLLFALLNNCVFRKLFASLSMGSDTQTLQLGLRGIVLYSIYEADNGWEH